MRHDLDKTGTRRCGNCSQGIRLTPALQRYSTGQSKGRRLA